MKLALFGATGGTGVTKALAAGHEVVAIVRKPAAIETKHEHLKVVAGDVTNADSIKGSLDGIEAVLSTIGPPDNKNPGTLLSVGLANIVAEAERAGAPRLVFESGLMMTDGSELSFFGNIGVSIYRSLNRKLYDDKAIAEASIKKSKLDWVIVRPPALTSAPATGKYLAGPLLRVSPASSLSHEDAADCLVRALTENDWTKKIINVGH